MAHVISKYRGVWLQACVDPDTHGIALRISIVVCPNSGKLSLHCGRMTAGSTEQLSNSSREKTTGNLSRVCIPETITVVRESEDAYKPGLD